MVRLINKNNAKHFGKIISGYMQLQKYGTHIYEINNNYLKPCIYAMWHHDQFCIYGVGNKDKVSILISNSADGDIVAYAVEGLGFKTVRGSSGRQGAIESTLKMVELLEQGESVAIMVDGPSGPLHNVKNGVVRIAKMSGAPIIPMGWYCNQLNFVNLPSWDNMTAPIGPCKIVNLYGDPIYVPKDATPEIESEVRKQLKASLEDIRKRLPDVHKEALKNKVWNVKRK